MLPFALAALTYGVGYYYRLDTDTVLLEIGEFGAREGQFGSRKDHTEHYSARQTMDESFVLDPNAPPAHYCLTPRRTRYRTIIEPASTVPRVTNPIPADEVWEEVDMPEDEDTHTVRRGLLASVMKVDDDDEEQPVRKRKEEDKNTKTLHLPENLSTEISTQLIRTLTAQLKYMHLQLRACKSQQEKDVVERMIENLESAMLIATDMGGFIAQLADGGKEAQIGLVEVLTQRAKKDVGKGQVSLDKVR